MTTLTSPTVPVPAKIHHPVLFAATILVIAILTVAAVYLIWQVNTPSAPAAPVLNSAELTFLNMAHDQGFDNNSPMGVLHLGHQVCRTWLAYGNNSGYRLAVGQLMAEHVPNYAAPVIARSALQSGLCMQR